MAQVQSPQLGYNTNVRYKDRVFHVQTEDSGVARPHVITHLFADGGRIIKSVKRAYANVLDEPDLIARVKKLMQEQHKAMLLALRAGTYNVAIGFDTAPAEAPVAMEPEPEPLSDDGARNTMPDGIPAAHLPTAIVPDASRVEVVEVVPASIASALRSPWIDRPGARLDEAMGLDALIVAYLTEELAAD